jgi:hypothetical protein
MNLGDSLSGLFAYTLHTVDIATGWEATGAYPPSCIMVFSLLFLARIQSLGSAEIKGAGCSKHRRKSAFPKSPGLFPQATAGRSAATPWKGRRKSEAGALEKYGTWVINI